MIAVIDYNAGNIASVKNALERLKRDFVVTKDPKIILDADKVIFPGQGRAGQAMGELKALELIEVLKQIKAPFLGICLGMQLLYEYSEEDDTACLGILKGKVTRFRERSLKVPLIGWSTVTQKKHDQWFREIPETMYAYFVNSLYVSADEENTLAYYTYGFIRAAAIVKKDNFYGTQFHPEKSGSLGVQLLKNFCELPFSPPRKGEMKEGVFTAPSTPLPSLPLARRRSILIIPAIDLMDGKCVRLRQGRFGEKTVYAHDPVSVAKSFIEDGAKYLHLVDLDGTKEGAPRNMNTILSILRNTNVPVQTGGGMRIEENIRQYLDAGVARVILGTSALFNPETVRRLIAEYGPGRIVVSVDGKDGKVAVKGWQETIGIGVIEFIQQLQTLGVTTIIYTDVKSDGELQGPNFEMIEKILKFPLKIIAAAGVTTIEQVQKLRDLGVYGVIVGKALYEERFNLQQAVKQVPQPVVVWAMPKPANAPTKRIIACMDVAEGRVKKGINFIELKDAGDPVEIGKRYSDQGVDELMFLDITATVEKRATMNELVKRVAKEIDIPFTVGGGVRTIDDIRVLLTRGADKVSIGSAAVKNPSFVKEAAETFGSQCIVVSVDPKWNGTIWEIYIKGGREATGIDAIEYAKQMESLGAGELLVNSLDRDGTKEGYDLELLKAISSTVRIPVIASSGAGKPEHFVEAFDAGADAALAAGVLHREELSIETIKRHLVEHKIDVRTRE